MINIVMIRPGNGCLWDAIALDAWQCRKQADYSRLAPRRAPFATAVGFLLYPSAIFHTLEGLVGSMLYGVEPRRWGWCGCAVAPMGLEVKGLHGPVPNEGLRRRLHSHASAFWPTVQSSTLLVCRYYSDKSVTSASHPQVYWARSVGFRLLGLPSVCHYATGSDGPVRSQLCRACFGGQ